MKFALSNAPYLRQFFFKWSVRLDLVHHFLCWFNTHSSWLICIWSKCLMCFVMVLSWSKTQNVNHGAWSYVQEVLCYVAYYPTDILRHILFTGAVSVLVVNNEFIDTKRCSESAGKAITEYSNCEANTCGQYGSCVPARTLQGYYCYCAADGMPSMSCDRKLSPIHHST